MIRSSVSIGDGGVDTTGCSKSCPWITFGEGKEEDTPSLSPSSSSFFCFSFSVPFSFSSSHTVTVSRLICCTDADVVCFPLGLELHGAASSSATSSFNSCIITSSTTAISCSSHSNFPARSIVEVKYSDECDVSVVIVCEELDSETPGFSFWAPEVIDDDDISTVLFVAISVVISCCCFSCEDSRTVSSCPFVSTSRCLITSISLQLPSLPSPTTSLSITISPSLSSLLPSFPSPSSIPPPLLP